MLLMQPSPRVIASPVVVNGGADLSSDPCAEMGVRIAMGDHLVNIPANLALDDAGHKYRKDGSRSAWLTANGGPVYVHAVGGALPRDTGSSPLSLFMIRSGPDGHGFALSPRGGSHLDVTVSDGTKIGGRFEAEVSSVASVTQTPALSAPIIHVRGTFCLPALPANPRDTRP